MKYSEKQKAELIRQTSSPNLDQQKALKANAELLDALYRLTFTADKLSPAQIDELINGLHRKANEITVLLGRICDVNQNGFSLDLFSDTVTEQISA